MKRRAFLGLGAATALGACAPLVQKAGVPALGFSGPRLDPDALVSFDGTRLPMTVWKAEGEPWAVIVGLHGMNDYAEAFTLAAPWWAKEGITTYAYDQRGFGRGPHRGVWGGEDLMVEDVRTAVALARARHPKAIVTVMGHSMGGAVAIAAFASDRPPAADRVILATPAVWGWSRQALPNRLALWIAAHLFPYSTIAPPSWLTRHIQASDNIAILRRMGRDPNMIWDTRIDAIYGLMKLMQDGDQRIGLIRAPTIFLYGAKDEIIPKEAAFHAARQLKPPQRTAYYPHGWHLLTRDLQGPVVWRDIESFLRDAAAPLPSGAPGIPGAPS